MINDMFQHLKSISDLELYEDIFVVAAYREV